MDKILNNFFGMNLECQLAFLDEVENNKENILKVTYDDFHDLFSLYHYQIKFLLENKDRYYELNSDQRRYVRYNSLKDFSYAVLNHHSNYSKENEKRRFEHFHAGDYFFIDEYKRAFKRLFNPDVVAPEEAEEELNRFSMMSNIAKDEFIEKFSIYYGDMKDIRFPVENQAINAFEDVVLNIIGKDLYPYYEMLHPSERIYFLDCISNNIKNTSEYNISVDNKEAVRNEKVNAIGSCIKMFLK